MSHEIIHWHGIKFQLFSIFLKRKVSEIQHNYTTHIKYMVERDDQKLKLFAFSYFLCLNCTPFQLVFSGINLVHFLHFLDNK